MKKDIINTNIRKETANVMVKTGMEHKAGAPLVSVIIPAYNAENYIKQCVDSVLEQTYENIEVICIDDGSVDTTFRILQFLAHKDKRVVLLQQKHLGVSAARNKGLKYATGKYISFVEADDYLQNRSYEVLVQHAEKKNADILIFGANMIGEVPEWASPKKMEKPGYYGKGKAINALFSKSGARSLWTCFFRKDLLDKGNSIKFNEHINYGEDILFLFEYVPKAENVLVIGDIIYNHRFGHEGSVTRSYAEDAKNYFQSRLLLTEQIADSWKNSGILENTEDKFITWLIHEVYCLIKELPSGIHNWAASEVIKLIEKLELKYYCIDWNEKEHFDEIVQMAEMHRNRKLEFNDTEKRILLENIVVRDKGPLVSVIIPTLNAEEYIKQCVDSLLNQTYGNIEVICVDVGSTDHTVPILKYMQEKDNRLILIEQEKAGISAARNIGLDRAKGKYISFVEAEDYMQWNSYEILVQVAEKNCLDLVIFGGNAIGAVPEWIQRKLNTQYKYYENESADRVIFEEESARPFLWLHFIRRELFERGTKIRFDESMEFGGELLLQFEYIPRAESTMVIVDKLYNFRAERICLQSTELNSRKDEQDALLMSKVIAYWKETGLLKKREDEFVTWLVCEAYRFIKSLPLEKQFQVARQTIDIIKNNHLKYYCIDWHEMEHLAEIFDIAEAAQEGKAAKGKRFKEGSVKNREPLVSVIVPTYNVDEYIKQCVDSLLDQTYKNIEVICIDDGSTDNTVPILKFMQEKDERLILIQQEHAGVSAARNKGLDAARGKYISFVDSDDFMQWNSYEILVNVAEKNQLDLIIFGGNAVGEAPEWIQKKLNTKYKYYEKGTAGKVVFEEESARPFLWLHFIKRELIEKGDKLRFNETMEMGEDQLFQFEYVPRAESVMVLEDKLYNYRIGRNCSLMQLYEKQRMKKFDSHILLISKVIESWKDRGLLWENEDQLITWIVNLTYWALIFFPKPFQPELAQKVVNLVKKYDIKDYCIAWYEKEHWEYMKDIAGKKIDKEEEIREIREKMNQEKYQIQEILKSRAFKLGRLTTPKSERINLGDFFLYN